MSNEYFKKALKDFTTDFASGGAIRAMADKGYTVKQIKERLDFPTPTETIREVVWQHFVKTGRIRLEPPSNGEIRERISYEKVQDEYGRSSFKQVVVKKENSPNEYFCCEFGKMIYQNRRAFEKKLDDLCEDDRDYILDLPWPLSPVWHVKDERMTRIVGLMEKTKGTVMRLPNENELFHIHTYRCGHAEEIPDEEYIRKALSLGKTGIWFSDHAPFPKDPFGLRMKMEELPEYLSTLSALKDKYKGVIDVHIGLESEYFPSFDSDGYYEYLLSDSRLEFLLLGQHMAEDPKGGYTYDWDEKRLRAEEYKALCGAVSAGMEKGYFAIAAHPDRCFRKCTQWLPGMEEMSKIIHNLSVEKDIPLEINMGSYAGKNLFWPEFWALKPGEEKTLYGLDAHRIREIDERLEAKRIVEGQIPS